MQTIVRNGTDISLYYLDDSKTVDIGSDETTISSGGTPELIISDCDTSNATLHTGVDAQATWWGWKYKHDGSSWSANADWKGSADLAGDLNDSTTTISVNNTNPFTSSGTVQIDDEKITYTGVDGTNLTGATRGASSTSAASHDGNSDVKQI